jgi:hypothetical protein
MKNFMILTLSILALALIPACDSDSDSSGSTAGDAGSTAGDTGGTAGDTGGTAGDTGGTAGSGFTTGLDGTLALSEMTDEQQIAGCEAGDEYMKSQVDPEMMKTVSCVYSGMMSGMMGMTCQEAYDGCMAEPLETEETDCSEDIDDLSACTDVTIAELEACFTAEFSQNMEMLSEMAAMTCDDIEAAMSDPEGGGMMEEPPTPAACEGLDEKCPAFFADDEDDMGDMGDMGDDMDDM